MPCGRFAKANLPFFYTKGPMNKSFRRLHSCATPLEPFRKSTESRTMTIESAVQEHFRAPSKLLKPLKWSLLAGGTALAVYGAARKSPWSVALGTATGLAAGIGPRANGTPQGTHFNCSFAVNCSPEEAYRYWRRFENLPSFMRHLQSVKDLGDGRWEWIARGPLENPVRWIAEVEEDVEGRRISWRSIPSLSGFQIRGTVEFASGTAGRGAIVETSIQYAVPGGPAGHMIATLLGKNPEFAIREDLRRFKALMEAGEIPTTQGQPHGSRSKLISAAHKIHPQKLDQTGAGGLQPAELRAS